MKLDHWDGRIGADDIACVSASTIGSALAAPRLQAWKIRQIAEALIEEPEVVAQLARHEPAVLASWVKGAPYRKQPDIGLNAADAGTLLHDCFEAALLGNPPPEVPEALWPMLELLYEFLSCHTIEPIATELVVYDPYHRVAGRGDLWAKIDGDIWYVDLKTKLNDPIDKPAKMFVDRHCLQASIYAFCNRSHPGYVRVYEEYGGRRYLFDQDDILQAGTPPKARRAGILQLTPRRCELYQLKISAERFITAVDLARIWEWLHIDSRSAYIKTPIKGIRRD